MKFCQLFCSAIQYWYSLSINEVIGHGQNGSEGEQLGHITSSPLKVQKYHIHSAIKMHPGKGYRLRGEIMEKEGRSETGVRNRHEHR